MSGSPPRVFLLRHGETERSITRRHTEAIVDTVQELGELGLVRSATALSP